MGLRPTEDDEKRLGPATTLHSTVALSLSSRPKRRDLRFYGPFVEMFFDGEWQMGLLPTEDDERRLGPATTLHSTVALSLSSRPKGRDLQFHGPFVGMFLTERSASQMYRITKGFMARSRRACPE
jgi:hypothetical protein